MLMLETLVYIIDYWFWLIVPSILFVGFLAALPSAIILVLMVVKGTGEDSALDASPERTAR